MKHHRRVVTQALRRLDSELALQSGRATALQRELEDNDRRIEDLSARIAAVSARLDALIGRA